VAIGMVKRISEKLERKVKGPIDGSSRQDVIQLCRVCQARSMPFQTAYDKFWYRCPECGFLQVEVSPRLYADLHEGEGLAAGTGPGGGGYREYFLSGLLRDELPLPRVLLYGTGNTPTFGSLWEEGVDVWGCDLSRDLIRMRNDAYAGNRFFHPDEFSEAQQYDIIVAVEVIEHFVGPLRSLRLLRDHLSDHGIITGTTDFYEGGSVADHIYLKPRFHVAYWSHSSLQRAGAQVGLPRLQLFELECPGSVKPDEKFGLLWPRKRVFFLYAKRQYDLYFRDLRGRYDILPIDRP
jgi:SAM-dependent methyltransferase